MKHKFLRFRDSLGDLIRSAVQIAVHVLCGYLLSLLVEHTIGERWPDISEIISHVALIAANVLSALQFIALMAVQVYRRVKKELKDEHDRNP